jgi:hypothetical protein
MPIPTDNQHPDNSIVLHNEHDKNYLLAFRDTAAAVPWLASLTNTSHEHNATRKIVEELGTMLYMMPARQSRNGQVKVGWNCG